MRLQFQCHCWLLSGWSTAWPAGQNTINDVCSGRQSLHALVLLDWGCAANPVRDVGALVGGAGWTVLRGHWVKLAGVAP
jgi:hypothetical protein